MSCRFGSSALANASGSVEEGVVAGGVDGGGGGGGGGCGGPSVPETEAAKKV